jgi:hypothetical protein
MAYVIYNYYINYICIIFDKLKFYFSQVLKWKQVCGLASKFAEAVNATITFWGDAPV